MIKRILIILFTIIIASCNNQNHFTIVGNTDRVGDAILQTIDPSNNHIDTTSIKNGEFSFKKKIINEELFRVKFHDGSSFNLLAKVGENIKIDFQKEQLNITGSIGSEKLLDLDQELLQLTLVRDSITKELQNLSGEKNYDEKIVEYRELFFKKIDQHKQFLKKFIDANQNSKICLIALFQQYGRSSPILTIDEDLEVFEKVLKNLKLNFSESNHIKILEEQVNQFKPLAYGQPAPNFTLPDINNKNVSLSDYKGKVVLVDFWAAWCVPCRMAHPKLIQLYEKYKDDDFDILSVSLDGTSRQQNPKSEWLKAIEQDNVGQWTHVSNLTGWETPARELYNFNSIPYTVIVDKNGKIAAKNLRGTDLEIKIKNLLEDDES